MVKNIFLLQCAKLVLITVSWAFTFILLLSNDILYFKNIGGIDVFNHACQAAENGSALDQDACKYHRFSKFLWIYFDGLASEELEHLTGELRDSSNHFRVQNPQFQQSGCLMDTCLLYTSDAADE